MEITMLLWNRQGKKTHKMLIHLKSVNNDSSLVNGTGPEGGLTENGNATDKAAVKALAAEHGDIADSTLSPEEERLWNIYHLDHVSISSGYRVTLLCFCHQYLWR